MKLNMQYRRINLDLRNVEGASITCFQEAAARKVYSVLEGWILGVYAFGKYFDAINRQSMRQMLIFWSSRKVVERSSKFLCACMVRYVYSVCLDRSGCE